MQCIKDSGYSFVIPRIYQETGHVDPNGAASVRAAAAVGLATDVYIYPAGFQSNNGAQMANDVINAIRGLPVGRVWLDIEGVGKSWPSSTSLNQKLFRDLADTLVHAGLSVGVYTQGWQWNSIMGSSFTYGSSFPLWYAEYGQGPGHYSTTDGTCSYSGSSQSFSGFSAFGGWSRPFAKQYNGDCSKCGCGTDANIVP
jgi:GH25 family lysozyme M1 (1,4-beta-N-acetylmuramidase)